MFPSDGRQMLACGGSLRMFVGEGAYWTVTDPPLPRRNRRTQAAGDVSSNAAGGNRIAPISARTSARAAMWLIDR